jgi:hypothetical protein
LFHTRLPPGGDISLFFFVHGGTSQNIFDVNHHLRYLVATAFDDTHRLSFVLQPLTGPLLIMDPASGERQHAARATLNPSLAGRG